MPFFALQTQDSELLRVELGVILLLTLAALIAIVARRIKLPYTVTLVSVGLLLSFFPNPFGLILSSDLILAILVPPLIFEATLNMRWENLRANLMPILALAVFGTLLGSLLVAAALQLSGDTFLPQVEMPFAAAFAFGALISATDPVAVIALFRTLGVSQRLAILVEGESLFNDGVAIVIFTIAVGAAAGGSGGEQALTVTGSIVEFVRVAVGGLGVGVILGFLVSYVILRNVDDHLIETATTVALAFGAFVLAEEIHVSGVLSVVAAGIFVGNVGELNTSPTTRISLENFWEFAAFVTNSVVFLLIGLDADLSDFQPNLALIVLAVVVVLASRAIVVYGVTGIFNRVVPRDHIPTGYRHVMFWGGLRGAISLALALSLSTTAFDPLIIRELQIMAFGVVLFTLLVQGTTITALLRRLGLGRPPEHRLEQEKRRALLYASRAGRRALEEAFTEGSLSAELHLSLATLYDAEIDRRNRRLRELLYDYPELEQGMILQVRRDLLRAERTALRDANQRGLISDEAYGDLIRGTDNQLEALKILWASLLEDQQFGGKAGQ